MEKINLGMDEMYPVIKIMLENGGTVNFNPRGTSMLPTIHNDGDRVILKKPDGRLQRLDIALFQRGNGQFVLHRVVKVNENDYLFLGDNQTNPEQINVEAVIGKVVEIIRNGKHINVENKFYKAYSVLWYCLLPLRKFISPIKKARKILFPTKAEIINKATAVADDIMNFDYKSVNFRAEKIFYQAVTAYILQNKRFKRNLTYMAKLIYFEVFLHSKERNIFTNLQQEIVTNYYNNFVILAGSQYNEIINNCYKRLVEYQEKNKENKIMEKEKIINGELHIYCESDGEYYPKHKTENGVQMELDEKYFVYVLSGDSIDKSIARNKVDPYLDEFYSENFEEQEYHFYKRAREKFLKEEKPILYRDLKDEQFLNTHLNDVEAQATKLEKKLIEQYSVRENLTENLKRENMLLWIQRYNSIKIRAKEVVLETYIYV